MRISTRSIVISTIFLVCMGYWDVSAQKIIVSNRDDFSLSIGYPVPLGKKYRDEQPTILANMKSGVAVEAGYSTALLKKLKIGININYTTFSNWNYPSEPLYTSSTCSFFSTGVTVAYKTWSPTNLSSNKLYFYGAVTPGITAIAIQSDSNSPINSGSESNPLEVHSMRPFIKATIGGHLNVSQNIAVFVLGNYQISSSQSRVFSDRQYSFISFNLGVSARLFKDNDYKLSF